MEKGKEKYCVLARGKFRHLMDLFSQPSFVSTECYIPFTGDEYCSHLQKDPGYVVGISKSFFYISACVV